LNGQLKWEEVVPNADIDKNSAAYIGKFPGYGGQATQSYFSRFIMSGGSQVGFWIKFEKFLGIFWSNATFHSM
jgi:hypothetical protein